MILPGLSMEEYSALPGYNSSLCKIVARESLMHARAYLDGLRKESDALDFGHSFHEMLLRGKEEFVVRPETYPAGADHADVKSKKIAEGSPLPWRSNAKWCKAWIEENNPEGKTVHTAEEVANMRGMIAAIQNDPDVSPYLDGQCELAVTAERRGIAYKALVDLLPAKGPIIDFKKAASANPRQFVKQALDKGYHLQAALNVDVLAWNGDVREAFWLVAVEAEPPFAIWPCKLEDVSPSFLRMGRAQYLSAVNLLEGAKKSGNWPSYPRDIQPEIYVPSWMGGELEKT